MTDRDKSIEREDLRRVVYRKKGAERERKDTRGGKTRV